MSRPWTRRAPLPGGDVPGENLGAYLAAFEARCPWLPPALAERWVDAYGTRAERLAGKAKALRELGRHFGGDLYQREVEYLIREEWARTAEDVLWRRSKLGLELKAPEAAALGAWMEAEGPASARS